MANPVFCSDGFTYDRKNAERLAKSPFTRKSLQILAPNVQLRSAIIDTFPYLVSGSKASVPSPAGPSMAISAKPVSYESGERDGQGLLHGQGERQMASGTRFVGCFEHGVFIEGTRSGRMPSISEELVQDTGKFNAEGKLEGRGMRRVGAVCVFSDDFLNGDVHGSVRICSADGSRYEGQSFDNFANGQGHFISEDGVQFRGSFRDSVFEGQNNVVIKDGSVFTGVVVNNSAQGRGTFFMKMHAAGGRQQVEISEYTGLFEQGKAHGHGTLTWQSGMSYEGQFVRGKAAGRGLLRSAKGTSWSGSFAEGRPVGRGTYRNANNNLCIDSNYKGFQRNRLLSFLRPAKLPPLVSVCDVPSLI